MSRRPLVLALLAAAACSRQTVDLTDRTCGDACLSGYVCNPLTTTCSPAIDIACDGQAGAICPDSTKTGDACPMIGTYVPCPGAAADTCDYGGCRTCDTSKHWTDCTCVTGDSCICTPTNGGVEICDGLDNDCNHIVDDAPNGAQGCIEAWIDRDGDGFGDEHTPPVCLCAVPPGYVTNGSDSNDNDPNVHPGAGQLCNGIDDTNTGAAIPDEQDNDGDGYVECQPWVGTITGIKGGGDCDDTDALTHPGAPEICDGVANTCIGAVPANEVDSDNDGWVQCTPWNSHKVKTIVGGGDCDPSSQTVHPGADEVLNDIDDNCVNGIDECISNCKCGSDLFGCYTLDSSPPQDGSPNHNNCVDPGTVSIVSAKINNGIVFSSAIWVRTASGITAPDVGTYTLSAWIEAATLPSTGNLAYIIDAKSQYTMRTDSKGHLVCAFADSSGTVYATNNSPDNVIVTTTTFQHVACTFDGSAITGYVNGNVVATASTSASPRTGLNNPFSIGDSSLTSTSAPFNGVIDHVQGFSQAHSAHQICLAAGRTGCP